MVLNSMCAKSQVNISNDREVKAKRVFPLYTGSRTVKSILTAVCFGCHCLFTSRLQQFLVQKLL